MDINRRRFLGATAAAAFPYIIPASVLGDSAPSKLVRVGIIGCGRISRGFEIPNLMKLAEKCRIVALSDLDSVRLAAGKPWRVPHGVKFVGNPAPDWSFQPLNGVCDPGFTDGGFDVPPLEIAGAEPFVIASERFLDKDVAKCKGLVFTNVVGKGRVIFVASLDSPGAPGVRRLYSFLLAKAMEAVGRNVWPKVECADMVRWSVYPDGTIYLLNTEPHFAQEAVVERMKGAERVTLRLAPGEIKSIH